jgi:hypothetical protein
MIVPLQFEILDRIRFVLGASGYKLHIASSTLDGVV